MTAPELEEAINTIGHEVAELEIKLIRLQLALEDRKADESILKVFKYIRRDFYKMRDGLNKYWRFRPCKFGKE